MFNLPKNMNYCQQEITTKYLGTIPHVEEFTKNILDNLFDCIINTSRKISVDEIKVLDKQLPGFYEKYLKDRNKRRGMPDLLCIKKGDILFVEVKNEGDSLGLNQIEWANKNPQFNILVLNWKQNDNLKEIVKQSVQFFKFKSEDKERKLKKEIIGKTVKIERLENKIKELEEQIDYMLHSPNYGV